MDCVWGNVSSVTIVIVWCFSANCKSHLSTCLLRNVVVNSSSVVTQVVILISVWSTTSVVWQTFIFGAFSLPSFSFCSTKHHEQNVVKEIYKFIVKNKLSILCCNLVKRAEIMERHWGHLPWIALMLLLIVSLGCEPHQSHLFRSHLHVCDFSLFVWGSTLQTEWEKRESSNQSDRFVSSGFYYAHYQIPQGRIGIPSHVGYKLVF